MTTPVVKINNEVFSANQTISWGLTSGVREHTAIVELTRQRAERIVELARAQTPDPAGGTRTRASGPLSLTITIDGHGTNEHKNLFIIGTVPGNQPSTLGIHISDARWLWARQAVVRDYNQRRRSGTRRLLNEDAEGGPIRPEKANIVADAEFKPWTLNGSTRWTARDALVDVLGALMEPGLFTVPANVARSVPIESLAIRASGTQAVAKILSYLPGYDLYQDYDGKIVVYDTLDGSESAAVLGAGPPHKDSGGIDLVDRSFIRPRRVHVLLEREVELRFDYEEDNQNRTRTRGREPLEMQNVMPSSDFRIGLTGDVVTNATTGQKTREGGQIVTQGEYIKIGDSTPSGNGLLAAWNGLQISSRGPLSQANVRLRYLGGMRNVVIEYGRDENGAEDVVWVRRVTTLARHWRRTFRLPKTWKDRIRSWRAYRVGVLAADTENAGRAPSPVFMDHTIRPSEQGLLRNNTQRFEKGWLIDGHADLIADSADSPFEIRIVDPDQGIFEVIHKPDPWGDYEMAIPGHLVNVPTMNLRAANKLATAADVFVSWNNGKMAPEFKFSTILTCIQAAPNNEGRFHRVTIEKARAQEVLGRPIGEASGPDWTVIVGGGLLTAMFAWTDDQANAIRESFYTGAPLSDNLLINNDHVQAWAEAAAARIYSLLLDRDEGSSAFAFQPGIKPTGSLKSVFHVVGQSGEAGTFLSLPPIIQPVDLLAFLPDSVRQVVLRQVQP